MYLYLLYKNNSFPSTMDLHEKIKAEERVNVNYNIPCELHPGHFLVAQVMETTLNTEMYTHPPQTLPINTKTKYNHINPLPSAKRKKKSRDHEIREK